jgi:predicted Zn-dependent protease
MLALGRSPVPLGIFLDRLGGDGGEDMAFISTHPVTAERVEALRARDAPTSAPPLLEPRQWQALKAICAGEPPGSRDVGLRP